MAAMVKHFCYPLSFEIEVTDSLIDLLAGHRESISVTNKLRCYEVAKEFPTATFLNEQSY